VARIESAITSIVAGASVSSTLSCAAVTHGSYMRMLLAFVGNTSLIPVATMELQNCCINVVDVSRERFHPVPVSASEGDRLALPEFRTVRVNEKRHLVGLV
jgi:broad specificity phosphatase PhoE